MDLFYTLRFWDSTGPFSKPCVQLVKARVKNLASRPWVEIETIGETDSVYSLEDFENQFSSKDCMFLLPGFVDSHLHLLGLGKKESEINLSDFRSAQDIVQCVRARAMATPKPTQFVGYGWDETKLGLKIEELIRIFDTSIGEEIPVFLKRHCRHSALANKSMRKWARRPDLPCWIHDDHLGAFLEVLDKPSEIDSERFVLRAQEILLARGIVGVGDMSQDEHSSFVLRSLFSEGKIKIDVAGVIDWGKTPSLENSGPDKVASSAKSPYLGRPAEYSFFWAKKFLDGSLGSSTAFLTQSYADQAQNYGKRYLDVNGLLNVSREILQRGYSLSFHAIGDGAVDQIIEVNERLRPLLETRAVHHLHRVEHAQVLRDDQIEYFARNPFWSFHLQPIHRQTDEGFSEFRLGRLRLLNQGYRAFSIVKKNIATCLGSDAPIDLEDPLRAIQAMVGHPNAQERMSLVRGLWHSTLHAMSVLGFVPPKFGVGSRAVIVALRESDKILSFRESEFC